MNHTTKLIVVEGQSDEWRNRWNALTQEDRRAMTVPQIIKAMGPLFVGHPQFKQRPRSLLPIPNLAGKQPMISEHHMSFFRLNRQTIRFALS